MNNNMNFKMNFKLNSKKVNMHISLPVSTDHADTIGTHYACMSPNEPWCKKCPLSCRMEP